MDNFLKADVERELHRESMDEWMVDILRRRGPLTPDCLNSLFPNDYAPITIRRRPVEPCRQDRYWATARWRLPAFPPGPVGASSHAGNWLLTPDHHRWCSPLPRQMSHAGVKDMQRASVRYSTGRFVPLAISVESWRRCASGPA
jgi:hypothetical protein